MTTKRHSHHDDHRDYYYHAKAQGKEKEIEKANLPHAHAHAIDRRRAVAIATANTFLATGCTTTCMAMSPTSAAAAAIAAATPASSTKTISISPTQPLPNTKTNAKTSRGRKTTNSFNDVVQIPRIGYSLYKTPNDNDGVQRGINLALSSGVRHFDVASLYGTNNVVGETLLSYCLKGLPKLDSKGFVVVNENENTNENANEDGNANVQMDEKKKKESQSDSKLNENENVSVSVSISVLLSSLSPKQQKQYRKRRRELFLTHKIQNSDHDTNVQNVKSKVLHEMENSLRVEYLDMLMIHSPLTDRERILGTYRAMVELKNEGLVRAIGVCNFGTAALGK